MKARSQVNGRLIGGEVVATSPREAFIDTLTLRSPLSRRRGDEGKASGGAFAEWGVRQTNFPYFYQFSVVLLDFDTQ